MSHPCIFNGNDFYFLFEWCLNHTLNIQNTAETQTHLEMTALVSYVISFVQLATQAFSLQQLIEIVLSLLKCLHYYHVLICVCHAVFVCSSCCSYHLRL